MHFLLVGGHPTPALSFIEQAQSQHHTLSYIGRPVSARHHHAPNEQALLQAFSVTYYTLNTPKFDRHRVLRSLLTLPRLVRAYTQAKALLLRNRPDAVIAFGGFLSLPVGLAAARLKLPLILHEQTAVAGLANEWLAKIAQAVAISYPTSAPFFPASKVKLTGNLLRPQLFDPTLPLPSFLPGPLPRPLLYITGGSQGSRFINTTVAAIYPQLLQEYIVLHQTGPDPESKKRIAVATAALPASDRRHLFLSTYLDADQAAAVFHHAFVVIGRAGANTIAELMATAVPALLIPLEPTHRGEQLKNAQLLASRGAAIISRQAQTTPTGLLDDLQQLSQHYPKFHAGAKKLRSFVYPHAAQTLLELAQTTVKRHRHHHG